MGNLMQRKIPFVRGADRQGSVMGIEENIRKNRYRVFRGDNFLSYGYLFQESVSVKGKFHMSSDVLYLLFI